MYGTTFTLPFGTGACGFAATATATLPIGRLIGIGAGFAAGGGVWIDDLPLAGLFVSVLPAAATATDVNLEPLPVVALAAGDDATVAGAALVAAAALLAAGALAGAAFLLTGLGTGFAIFFATGLLATTFLATGLRAAALVPALMTDFLATTFPAAGFLLAALPAAGVFAALVATGFLTAAFLAAGLVAAGFFTTAFFTAGFFTGAFAFLAADLLATGLADFFGAVLAAFLAGFLTATSGVSLYSLVTGKRAVIPCPDICGNRSAALAQQQSESGPQPR